MKKTFKELTETCIGSLLHQYPLLVFVQMPKLLSFLDEQHGGGFSHACLLYIPDLHL